MGVCATPVPSFCCTHISTEKDRFQRHREGDKQRQRGLLLGEVPSSCSSYPSERSIYKPPDTISKHPEGGSIRRLIVNTAEDLTLPLENRTKSNACSRAWSNIRNKETSVLLLRRACPTGEPGALSSDGKAGTPGKETLGFPLHQLLIAKYKIKQGKEPFFPLPLICLSLSLPPSVCQAGTLHLSPSVPLWFRKVSSSCQKEVVQLGT